MISSHQLVELYAKLGSRISSQRSTDGVLRAVTAVAVDVIPAVVYASITRRRQNGYQTLGATHPEASANDRAQYDAGNGPCIDAATDGTSVVSAPDIGRDPRYPTFGPIAAAAEIGSMLSTQLVFDDDSIRASLNLYSARIDGFDEATRTTALVMATHGALAVAAVVARERAAALEGALTNSRTIGMAMGVLMSSQLLSKDQAFTLLRLASQNQSRKLHEVASDVADTGILDV